MKAAFAKLAIFFVIFLLGGLLVPVLVAAGEAAMASDDREDRFQDARKLIAVYQNQLSPSHVFLTITSKGGRDCGYDPESLFPSSNKANWKSLAIDRLASSSIERWEGEEVDEIWLGDIAKRITQSHSPFAVTFLRRCIEGTVFSPLCVSHVSTLDDGVEAYPEKLDLRGMAAKRAYCTFMDGVAAKQGISLADRSKENAAEVEAINQSLR